MHGVQHTLCPVLNLTKVVRNVLYSKEDFHVELH